MGILKEIYSDLKNSSKNILKFYLIILAMIVLLFSAVFFIENKIIFSVILIITFIFLNLTDYIYIKYILKKEIKGNLFVLLIIKILIFIITCFFQLLFNNQYITIISNLILNTYFGLLSTKYILTGCSLKKLFISFNEYKLYLKTKLLKILLETIIFVLISVITFIGIYMLFFFHTVFIYPLIFAYYLIIILSLNYNYFVESIEG